MNTTPTTADAEGKTKPFSWLYLSGRQLVAALSLGSLGVAVNQHPLELKLQKGGDVQFTAIGVLYAFRAKTSFFPSIADQSLQVCIDYVVGGDGRESNFFCRVLQ